MLKKNLYNPKTILTDVDGVLLDYFTPFLTTFDISYINNNVNTFEEAFGIDSKVISEMVYSFNNSDTFSRLPAFKDAVKYIHKLKEDGYDILVITAAGNTRHIMESRITNLEEVFGKNVFNDYMFVEPLESKDIYLRKFKDSYIPWVEDSIVNYHNGIDNGLDSILMDTDFNHTTDNLRHYHSWNEIYRYITKI